MASNPAFNRIEKDAKDGYAGFGGPGAGAVQQSAAGSAAAAGGRCGNVGAASHV